jgi:hypothetical protein
VSNHGFESGRQLVEKLQPLQQPPHPHQLIHLGLIGRCHIERVGLIGGHIERVGLIGGIGREVF